MTKAEYYLQCGIYKKWHTVTLAKFTNDKKALRRVKNYLRRNQTMFKRGTGIYLYGSNGVGKSHLLNASFKVLIEKEYSVKVIPLSDLISMFTSAWYSDDSKHQLSLLKEVQFLGIEEIGKEFRTTFKDADSKNEDLIVTVLDTILRYRLQNSLPTWFTSNLTPSALESSYSTDIFSMMKESAIPILVNGEDYRNLINLE